MNDLDFNVQGGVNKKLNIHVKFLRGISNEGK